MGFRVVGSAAAEGEVKPGDRYGCLIVLETLTATEAERPKTGAWVRVRCVCGRRQTVRARHLNWRLRQSADPRHVSCGCKAPAQVRAAVLAHAARASQ
jgi:hypothetical protein